MIPIPEKCTKRTQNVPDGHKISQMSVKVFQMAIKKHKHFFPSEALQNLPKSGFWFEKKPSGNPVKNVATRAQSADFAAIVSVTAFFWRRHI
jgi:hypothetical protein